MNKYSVFTDRFGFCVIVLSALAVVPELALAQIRLNELLSVVQLYKALGGGWQ